MSYSVVLIDDENIIVEGLRRVVDWESFNCHVADTANDAASGAEAIHRIRPDIVFTDIKMPDQSGLSMLAGLKSEFPAMQVSVLTGYRDFNYAQAALRLGVTRYLVKPSRMDEINEALSTMVERLSAKTPQIEPQSDAPVANDVVERALAYINARYDSKIALQDVAEHCYVSQWHLSKLLKKHVGKGLYELINDARICQAKILLQDPSLRIAQIGELVGYVDMGHFSRIFKSIVGITANEYRNNLKTAFPIQ